MKSNEKPFEGVMLRNDIIPFLFLRDHSTYREAGECALEGGQEAGENCEETAE